MYSVRGLNQTGNVAVLNVRRPEQLFLKRPTPRRDSLLDWPLSIIAQTNPEWRNLLLTERRLNDVAHVEKSLREYLSSRLASEEWVC